MGESVSRADRSTVAIRAANRCEYCFIHQDDSFQSHEVDHIVSQKHRGDSSLANLAYACAKCNAWKGSDIAGYSGEDFFLTPLFHPRRDRWEEHFRLVDGEIVPRTAIGETTARLLKLNLAGRISERLILAESGRYPR